MLEKVLPPGHQEIGESLVNMGVRHEHLNQLRLALNCYKQVLVIYEQCLSPIYQERSTIESQRLNDSPKKMNRFTFKYGIIS